MSEQTYYVEMRDADGDTVVEITTTPERLAAAIKAAAIKWCAEGDWGTDGARVYVDWWAYSDADHEDEVASGEVEVDIEPDHEALMEAAGAPADCDHEWTSEDEGGCDSNPGVWSTGGTSMMFAAHCIHCGLRRITRTTGSQHNPDEHDTVEYEMP